MPYWRVMSSDLGGEVGAGPAVRALGEALPSAELRPTLLTEYSRSTLRMYRIQWAHVQAWLAQQHYQTGVEHWTGSRLLEYVTAQIAVGVRSPSALRQACNAVVFYTQRAGVTVADEREAKEAVRRYAEARSADGVPPAWRVTGRRTPERGRRRGA